MNVSEIKKEIDKLDGISLKEKNEMVEEIMHAAEYFYCKDKFNAKKLDMSINCMFEINITNMIMNLLLKNPNMSKDTCKTSLRQNLLYLLDAYIEESYDHCKKHIDDYIRIYKHDD
jgi:hypothetical protein